MADFHRHLMLLVVLVISFSIHAFQSPRCSPHKATCFGLYYGVGEEPLGGSFSNHTMTLAQPLPPMRGFNQSASKRVITEEEPGSLVRAITQVHAILDLYYAQPDAVSGDLVLTTIEQVVIRSESSEPSASSDVLEDLEELVWRLGDLRLTPSYRVMDTLWSMQTRGNQKPSKQVGRMVRLLHNWYEWCGATLEAPPSSYLNAVLQFAADNYVTMSFALWDLFLVAVARQEILPRSAYSFFLSILARSPTEWRIRQCLVLQAMTKLSRESKQDCAPKKHDLEEALRASAREGHAQDAAWLLRHLHSMPDYDSTESETLFVEALWHCNETGSLPYMEKYVQSSSNLDERAHKMLLAKWSRHCAPGSGMRAEAVFDQMMDVFSESWKPDVEAVYSVVMAYLQERTVSLNHVMEADRFVRRCCQAYGLTRGAQSGRWRIFDRLLDAYTDYSIVKASASRRAEQLFQFFLVQHRQGRVAEEPDPFHLGHMLRQWNRRLPIRQSAARKSLEAVQLFSSMQQRGTISRPPDAYNLRQLLGTLARSNVTGYGDVAESFLPQVASVKDPYTAGHMYWCVIKCYCNHRDTESIVKAVALLDRMGTLYTQNPNAIRLTGAPYQTVMSTLGVLSTYQHAEAGFCSKTADAVLMRLETLYRAGNRRARLTHKLYRDAILCHENDPKKGSTERIQFYQARMQSLEEGNIAIELSQT